MKLTSSLLSTHLVPIFSTLLALTDALKASECSTQLHDDPQVSWQTTKCASCGSNVSKAKDTIFLNYNGTFTNGTLFDSSYSPGKPWPAGDPLNFTLGAGQVIKGFDAGLYKMCPGEGRRLKIAPEFAYGPKGTPDGAIPPNSTLIFNVELMGIGKIAASSKI